MMLFREIDFGSEFWQRDLAVAANKRFAMGVSLSDNFPACRKIHFISL